MNALFLTCALSVAPLSFHTPDTVQELKKIRAFIWHYAPNAEIKIQDRTPKPGEIHDNRGWERLPFRYRDMDIFIKRAPVYDRKRLTNA